jgi:glycosyltransferase involved in cell wall biosynthesis
MSALMMTKHFLARGHKAFCLCKRGSDLHKKLHDERLPHRSIRILSHYSPWRMLRIRRLFRKENVDVVHAHFLHDLWLLSPALWWLPEIRLFATCHMLFSRTKKKDWAHRFLYGRVNKLIVLTQIAREVHLRCLPVSSDQMVVIPHGVDLSEFSTENYNRNSIRDEFGIKSDQPLIGCIGRLDQGKGQEELIHAAFDVSKELPNCKFLIVGEETKGEGAEFSDKIRGLIKQYQLEKNVILTGYRADIPQILRALDIFVFPSYKETFGMSLLEAMAMRLPVVATNSGGVPEILDYGNCGILIPPRQAQPLAAAIKEYLKKPDLAQKMALLGQERVKQEYDLNLNLDRIEALYLDSADNREKPSDIPYPES